MAAAFFTPFAFHPNRPSMRRTTVGSGNPDISAAIPAMVSRHPYPVAMHGRRLWHYFHRTWRRWSDADNNLCVGGTNAQKEGAGCGEDMFLHRVHRSLELLPVKMRIAWESCAETITSVGTQDTQSSQDE